MQRIIAIWNAIDVLGRDGERLHAAADAIREVTKQFIAGAGDLTLTALDPLWDPEAEEVERPARLTEVPDGPVVLPAATPGAGAARLAAVRTADAASPADGEADAADLATAPARGGGASSGHRGPSGPSGYDRTSACCRPRYPHPGRRRSPRRRLAAPPVDTAPVRRIETLLQPPWREPPAHAFVKVPCGRCHSRQVRWWHRDPHASAA